MIPDPTRSANQFPTYGDYLASEREKLRSQGAFSGPSGWDRIFAHVPPRYVPTGYLFGIWLGMTKDELAEFSKW